MSIYSKLSKVQGELKAPKNQFNKFGKYKYRSCEDIMEGVKPLLVREGLVLAVSDEIKQVGDRYYVEATATLICTEEGDKHEVKAYAREADNKKGMDPAQLTGSTSSYARKYALNGLFAIDDTKDSDSTNKHGKETKNDHKGNKTKNNPIVDYEKQVKFMYKQDKERVSKVVASFLETHKVDKLADLKLAKQKELYLKLKGAK